MAPKDTKLQIFIPANFYCLQNTHSGEKNYKPDKNDQI